MASNDTLQQLFAELLAARDAGDTVKAKELQKQLYGRQVSVKFRPATGIAAGGPQPASKGIGFGEPRAAMPDGAPLDLMTVPVFTKRNGCGQKFVETAIERGHIPCFMWGKKVLLDELPAHQALHVLCMENGLSAVNTSADRIPELHITEGKK